MITRRTFIERSALALSALGLSSTSFAQGAGGSGRRFLFLHAVGGWDPLAVFAPKYGAAGIDMEPGSEQMTINGLPLVEGPGRPAVRAFFERHASRTLILNGVSTRSVNHETCQAVALTGSTSTSKPDWGTLLAAGGRTEYDLPHVVFSGPIFPGQYGVLVSRAQGALAPLITGRLLPEAEPAVDGLGGPASRLVDRFLARRTRALGAALPDNLHVRDLAEAGDRTRRILDQKNEIQLTSAFDPLSQSRTAIQALSQGLCRVASVTGLDGWDTHTDNSLQTPLFQSLFSTLDTIVDLLDTTPGPGGRMLSDDTLIVVTSEMARTPAYNATNGRDHWPYTTMMVIGQGITGGRVVGAYDDGFNGVGIRPEDGSLDPSALGIAPEDLGATLLQLGDIDPAEVLPFARPLTGLLT